MSSTNLRGVFVAGNPDSAEADDQFLGSLIDALDDIAKADRSTFSAVGYQRLTEFAADLRRLRSRAGGAITDLIAEIERYLNLEVEVLLRDGTRSGRRHIDRFMDEASKFARNGASLNAFLQWLDIASREEGGLKAGAPDVDASIVQILTIHMSKGAEWDVVAVPGLAEGTFPGINKSDPENWITNEKHIPFHLRGDSAELPVFSFNGVTKNSEAKKEIEAYGKVCNATKIREEIRLGYVAFTRARTHLIATTSWWRDGKDWVKPSSIFEQVALVAQKSGTILNNAVQPEDDDKNPKLEYPATGIWPRDPLGDKRAEFETKIALVDSTKPIDLSNFLETDLEIASWAQDAQALIHENTLLRNGGLEVALPPRLSTSTLVALHKDPTELALNKSNFPFDFAVFNDEGGMTSMLIFKPIVCSSR